MMRAVSPDYLLEPDYYRVAYHLAAQRLNQALADAPTEPPDVTEVIVVAEPLRENAKQTLERLAARARETSRFRRKARGLDAQEERLQRFIQDTVLPCTELVLAGAKRLTGDEAGAQEIAKAVRDRGASGPLSYRAYYNLACFEAPSEEDALEAAYRKLPLTPEQRASLDWLRAALRTAEGYRREELVRWTKKDPSFEGLRQRRATKKLFEDLLAAYTAPDRAGSGSSGASS